jgi:hypothetical protein
MICDAMAGSSELGQPEAYGEGVVSALFLFSVACPQASVLRAAPPLDRPANPARPGGGTGEYLRQQ